MNKLNWSKWGLTFFQSLGRHIGTAGMTWLGLGIKDNVIEWHNLWVALLVGAILPTFFTFLQNSPIPEEEIDEKITITRSTPKPD